MGLLDTLKDATGVGLTAEEQYRRAYTKGVFLQPADYLEASRQFTAAAEKFRKQNDIPRARRAEANAVVYRMVHAKDLSLIETVLSGIDGVPELERIASQTELMSGLDLQYELMALRAELQAEAVSDLLAKSRAYRQAAELAMKLGTAPLVFGGWLPLKGPTDKAMLRGFYYAALADYHAAFAVIPESPEDAQNGLHKAAAGFRQSQTHDWLDLTEVHIEALKARRHCWTCGREMQGRDHYFRYYPAATTAYHQRIIETGKEDTGMLDRGSAVTLCTVCGTAIEAQADRYAQMRAEQLRVALKTELDAHKRQIEQLSARISSLESRS